MSRDAATHDDQVAALGPLERRLLDGFQRDLPLLPRPFAAVGAALGVDEDEVLARLRGLSRAGLISRVGPVFRPHAVGASALAAMAVPGARLEEVGRRVGARPEVNHCYEREHDLSLWFVLTAPDGPRLEAALEDLAAVERLPVLSFPLVEAYHVDLGFPLEWPDGAGEGRPPAARGAPPPPSPPPLDPGLRPLVAAVERGLPLVPRPFAAVADAVGLAEPDVIGRFARWLRDGTVARLGVVVRHRRLGYRANAMAVWDVPDERVAEMGARLAAVGGVSLCYRRPRRPPRWRFNLFCMLHGRDRGAVAARVDRLARDPGLAGLARATLFSRRCFKQRGARYHSARPEA